MAASSLRFHLNEAEFLEHYWQKQPLLIRAAMPNFISPLSPDELAGLAMEPDVQSRIIAHTDGRWELLEGPFEVHELQREDLWTLLVQQVDQWVPEVAALRQCVDFLPGWRFDDVMVSYANDGGGVGPHFDRYDVFLLQGHGERLWRLGEYCDESTPRIDHQSLHLLESFTTVQEYLLRPGDVLYVPPGIAHWGIAQGECMTYSLGFRAPPVGSLLARLTDEVLDALSPDLLLEDRDSLRKPGRPGELTAAQIENAREAVINAIRALDTGRWLAEVVTEPAEFDEPADFATTLLPGPIMLNPATRVVWIDQGDQLEIFAQGDSIEVTRALLPVIQGLCAGEEVNPGLDGEEYDTLLGFLFSVGALINAE